MSQAEVADALGITRQTVREIEQATLEKLRRKLIRLIRNEADLARLAGLFEEACR